MTDIIRRGEIYYIDLSPVRNSEQGGIRPCVIVQNNKGNEHAPTTIVVPLTTKSKKMLPTHRVVREGTKESIALCEQVRTIDKKRLKERMGMLDEDAMYQVNSALSISFGLGAESINRYVT